MNKNRIDRTTPKRTSNSQPQFSIPLSNFAVDPRLAYVESVCSTLIESRFGPGFIFESSPLPIGRSQPAFFSDLLDGGEMLPSHFLSHLSFLGRIAPIVDRLRSDKFSGTQDATGRNASVNERTLQFWDARSQLSGTAFLGRGSP